LSAKQVIIQTGAVLNGRALAQTQVTLDANRITAPPTTIINLPGTIRGVTFEDYNGDGVRNGTDPVRGGWTVYLDMDNNGVFNAGEPSTVSDVNGNFIFSRIAAGTYHLGEVPKSGWMQTNLSGGRYTITLTSGMVWINNFGDFKLGSISGMKFNDRDGNGSINAGDVGLSGWTIVLKKVGGATVTTITDASGNFTFVGLGPGIYNLSEVMQSGWRQTAYPAQVRIYSGLAWKHADVGNHKR
jgi:hypothetical protein